MKLDLSEILNNVGKSALFEMKEPPFVDEDIECLQPIEGSLRFTNAGETLIVKGKAKTALALPCSRCVEYFEHPIEIAIDEQFELQPTNSKRRNAPQVTVIEEDENPIAGQLFSGYHFDLSEMLRQYLALEIPVRPLPPIDASGACSHCHRTPAEALGVLESADAEAPAAPSPFSKLQELIENEES